MKGEPYAWGYTNTMTGDKGITLQRWPRCVPPHEEHALFTHQAPQAEAVYQWRLVAEGVGPWMEGKPPQLDRDASTYETRTLYAAPVVPARAQEITDADVSVGVMVFVDAKGSLRDRARAAITAALAARTQGAK